MSAQILALLELDENSLQVVESLKRSGHDVIACKNFVDAIGVLQDKHIDLIMSDVHLENGGNVFDFLRWVRRNASSLETPFIMFSSKPSEMAKYVEEGVRISARMLGASMYVSMDSFDSDELRKQISSFLPAVNQAVVPAEGAQLQTKESSD
jgi:DNA-binding response OmpR family regulator